MASRNRRSRSRRKAPPKPIDLWRPTPPPPEPAPIVAAAHPSTLIRSLGDPPLPGQSAVAEHYFAAVVDQAASLATALAATAGLLREPGEEDLDLS
jgi:hypothetical protein